MERTRQNKGWALLGFGLFFLLLISLAVPANEKFDTFGNNNQADVETETENQQSGDGHLNKTNNIGDPGNNSTTLVDGETNILRRNKRPGRLLPLQLLYKEQNDTEERVIGQEFYGPPTSCDDLATLGYTLNGNYLVNGKNLSENQHKVEMIACLFKKTPGIQEGKKEERFGLIINKLEYNKKEAALTSNSNRYAKGIERLERPARLIPLSLLFNGKEKHATDKKFYGPASNCNELRQLGYTLNGYYLVNGKEEFVNSQVEVVYCKFKFPNAMVSKKDTKIEEFKLGFINLSPSMPNTTVETFKYIRKTRNTDIHHEELFKRPARLLPLKFIFGDEKPKFYGPAYNCDDLGELGYTLNGYYIVLNSYENVTYRRREVVLCRFKQSRVGEQVEKEKRLGFIAASKGDDSFAFRNESFCSYRLGSKEGLGVVHHAAASLSSSSRISAVDVTSKPYISSCNRFVHLFKLSGGKTMNLCIKNYTEGKPIPTEAELSVRHSPRIVGDYIWVQRDMHFCSFVGEECLTLSYRKSSIKEETIVTLRPYNQSEASQMWVTTDVSSGKEIHHQVKANMCLEIEDSSTAKENRKLVPNELPVGLKLCSNIISGWLFSPIDDTQEYRQHFLKIKNSGSNIVLL